MHFGYEEAARHLRRALELMETLPYPDREQLCDVLLDLGDARIRAGDRSDANATFDRAARLAHEMGSPERLARAALGVAPGLLWIEVGVFDRQLAEMLESARRALGGAITAQRSYVLARLAMALYWSETSPTVRTKLCDEACALHRGHFEEAERLVYEFGRLGEQIGDENAVHATLARLASE